MNKGGVFFRGAAVQIRKNYNTKHFSFFHLPCFLKTSKPWTNIRVLARLRVPLDEGMMTQNVMGESIAHLDKTRSPKTMTQTINMTEANVTGAGVRIEGMVVWIRKNLPGAERIKTGAEAGKRVVKGRTRSEKTDFYRYLFFLAHCSWPT
jgi:hypothetical protein